MQDTPAQDPFLQWYTKRAKPLVARFLPDKEGEWATELARLEILRSHIDDELTICFLGRAGVGKSTLINALVGGSRQLLPTTGVGPLTAQAITVRYGKKRSLDVEYHSSGHLNNFLFALEQSHEAKAKRGDDQRDAETPSDDTTNPSLVEQYAKQAWLLITGSPSEGGDRRYLFDCLREAMGQDRKWGTCLASDRDDAGRIRRVQEALSLAKQKKPFCFHAAESESEFERHIADHAAGFLSPLIDRLTVTWDSELLEAGITLVDLPGLGAAGDSFKKVTQQWIPKAQAVILVVDKTGIDVASAELLYKSEFLRRLIHAAASLDKDPVQFITAVTQIDNVASARYMEDKKKKSLHFAHVQEEMRKTVKCQLKDQLKTVWSSGGDARSQTEIRVADHLIDTLQVFPVSAVEYRRAIANDDEDRAFLTTDQSGIPSLRSGLIQLVEETRERKRKQFESFRTAFADNIRASLGQFRPAFKTVWNHDTSRKRADLLSFITSQTKDYHQREGSLNRLWKSEVFTLIREQVGVARGKAENRMRAFLAPLASWHVKILQAAVRRGGRFEGATREIDLPRDLDNGFDTFIAEAWNETILRQLREETARFAKDCADLVYGVYMQAKADELTSLLPPLESVHLAILADATRLQAIGEDEIEQLRRTIHDNLLRRIEPPIKIRCLAFSTNGLVNGAGARARILVLFAELAREVSDICERLALGLLNDSVKDVFATVRTIWNNRNPLAAILIAVKQHLPEQPTPSAEQHRQQRAWQEIEAALKQIPTSSEPVLAS